LQDLNAEAHCHACNIRFDSTFDRNVEVFFRIAPAIRPALNTVYCIGGPALSPHVSAQFVLPPGSRTEQKISLPPGEYSLSSLQSTDPFLITVSETGAASLQVSLQKRDNNVLSVYSDEDQAASHADWVLVNETEEEIVLRVEDRKWVSDAVTAAMVTSLAEFRSQFSSQVLSPDTEIAVEQVCILFSDLKNSTAMYRAEGDAPSYHRVREHFVMMRQIITENNGAVIKTIGDAVMASFSDPADGLSAALAIQRESASREDGLIIKIGLHWGPALTVNANNTLDYFGQTVNLASRLQKESKGGDVALSALLADDPRVQEFLKSGACAMERFTTQVRGVEDSVKMLRLTPRG
jgi:class 3 adenylate cyclase